MATKQIKNSITEDSGDINVSQHKFVKFSILNLKKRIKKLVIMLLVDHDKIFFLIFVFHSL
jgi:hypothetical protein